MTGIYKKSSQVLRGGVATLSVARKEGWYIRVVKNGDYIALLTN